MSIPIFINGLIPSTRDVREGDIGGNRIYMKIEQNGLDALENTSQVNELGIFEIKIPAKYQGASITLHIRHPWYKPADTKGTIQEYGFFHTAKLFHDFHDWKESGSPDPEWETESEYVKAQTIKNERVRTFRHKNIVAKSLHYIILIGAPFLGLAIAGLYGVIAGLVVSVCLELWSPYSSGLQRIWK